MFPEYTTLDLLANIRNQTNFCSPEELRAWIDAKYSIITVDHSDYQRYHMRTQTALKFYLECIKQHFDRHDDRWIGVSQVRKMQSRSSFCTNSELTKWFALVPPLDGWLVVNKVIRRYCQTKLTDCFIQIINGNNSPAPIRIDLLCIEADELPF